MRFPSTIYLGNPLLKNSNHPLKKSLEVFLGNSLIRNTCHNSFNLFSGNSFCYFFVFVSWPFLWKLPDNSFGNSEIRSKNFQKKSISISIAAYNCKWYCWMNLRSYSQWKTRRSFRKNFCKINEFPKVCLSLFKNNCWWNSQCSSVLPKEFRKNLLQDFLI